MKDKTVSGQTAAANSFDLCFLDAAELARYIREKEVSPVEVVKALLARITELNDRLRAFIHVAGERALEEAREAEKEIGKGRYRGPLHGIPVAYKDIFDVRGLPTTAGSRILAGYTAREDSTVAARLRAAGAVCLGKLNTWEFASGSMEVYGDARNPWNTEVVTSGSSSGSGAALAAHMIPLATGTDTGGSVRGPAHHCGLVGLRPSFGRISRAGIIPLSWSLDHPGPMARTVRDLALLLKEMAGPDPQDPTTLGQPPVDFDLSKRENLKGKRVGLPGPAFFTGSDPDVLEAFYGAVKKMEELGASMEEIDLPPAGYGAGSSWTIAYSEAFAFHRACFARRWADYTPAFRQKITTAALLSSDDFVTAQRVRQAITSAFLSALEGVDVIVTPTASHPAHPIGQASPAPEMLTFMRLVSLTGLPALSVPCGFSRAGLPIGIQLAGRMWAEAAVLGIGHVYEQATEWHKRRPPLQPRPVPVYAPVAAGGQGQVSAPWVLEMAARLGLDFITPADAAPIAKQVGPVKGQLADARKWLEKVYPSPWPMG